MSTLTRPPKVATDSPVRRPSPRRAGSRGAHKGLLFALPFLLGFLATYVVPIGYAFSQSLREKKSSGMGFGPTRVVFTGFSNFASVLGDGAFWSSMLCTLLFGWAGAAGLLITGWFACYWYYFPGDVARAFAGTIAGAAGPYLVYLIAQREYGLQSSLRNLTPMRLLVCAVGCAIASPALHHIWFILRDNEELLLGFFVMCVGDLAGSLIVLYTAKGLLTLRDRRLRAI